MSEGEGVEDGVDSSILNISTFFLALVTFALYLYFLRPTTTENNNNNGQDGTTTRTRTTSAVVVAAAAASQQQRRTNNNNNALRTTTIAAIQRTGLQQRPVLSENAIEVLADCKTYPPHVHVHGGNTTNKNTVIGGYNMLSENGLISFIYTKAAAVAAVMAMATTTNNNNSGKTKNTPIDLTTTSTSTNTSEKDENESVTAATAAVDARTRNNNNKLQRQERAKILSRLFAKTTTGTANTPPTKGSTFVIGLSNEKQIKDTQQMKPIIRVIKGLSSYYNVLVIVDVDIDNTSSDYNNSNSNSHCYEMTQKIHKSVVQTLRYGG